MKKKFIIILSFCMFLFVVGASFLISACGEKQEKRINEYNLHLVYDEQNMTLSAQEEVCYVNNSENAFDSVFFHLYPNAFRQEAKNAIVSNAKSEEAYYNGESYGNIEIKSVSFEQASAEYQRIGEDENILKVCLQESLFPDEMVKINISFVVNMPQINHRLGVGINTINFGNFYPIACVYEDGVGFSQELYHSNGDPFYSECANYKVTINYSNKFLLASSGQEMSSDQQSDRIIKTISANNVRDFCFVLSDKFEMVSKQIGQVVVNYYGYQNDEFLQRHLQTACDALQTFNNLFGDYPYTQLSVVKSNFLYGGMEYPNIVLISDSVEKEDFDYVIVHEVAHQWWYGVVGNDQFNHAWQDEALAEYSTLLFYKNNPQYDEDFQTMIASAENSYKIYVKAYTKVNGKADGVMDKPVCDFDTEPEYVQCTYTKGVLMLNALSKSIGEKNFIKALKIYYNKFKYKIASPADFIATFIKVSGGDMENFINSWLYDKVVIGE